MHFHEGLAKAKINGKWGFINKKGDFVIAPQFKDAVHFSYGLAGVMIDGKWSYINQEGKEVIAPLFEKVLPFDQVDLTFPLSSITNF
jgi:WG containing repeat